MLFLRAGQVRALTQHIHRPCSMARTLASSQATHGKMTTISDYIEGGVMRRQISKSEFKARALEFFRQVEATGEPIVVTDHGKPSLEIRPYRPERRNALAMLRGSVVRFEDPFAPVEDDSWEAVQ